MFLIFFHVSSSRNLKWIEEECTTKLFFNSTESLYESSVKIYSRQIAYREHASLQKFAAYSFWNKF